MLRKLVSLATILAASMFATAVAAQDAAGTKSNSPAGIAGGAPCQGTFQIAAKTYKLSHAVAYRHTVSDDEMISVLLSSVAIPAEKLKASLMEKGSDSGFIFFQPHVTVTFDASGKAIYLNSWADNRSFSISGPDVDGQLTEAKGRVRGEIKMTRDKGEDRKSLDAQFDLPLLVVPRPAAKPAPKEKPSTDDPSSKPDAPNRPALNVHELPLPKDAARFEYKKLVEQMSYESQSDVKTLAAFLAKQLSAQGWTSDDSDLITPKSAILNRKRGSAELTIFVKPAAQGSKVAIMSSGLSWDEPPRGEVKEK